MNPQKKWPRIVGAVLHALVAGLMLFAGSGKVFGTAPPEVVEMMQKHGLGDKLQLIGCGEMTSAALLLCPWTSPIGVLLCSSFWGGAICLHMSHGEPFVFQSILLIMVWTGGFLRGSVPLLRFRGKLMPPGVCEPAGQTPPLN
jgi:hypothetical protein